MISIEKGRRSVMLPNQMVSNDLAQLHNPAFVLSWNLRLRFESGWIDRFDETGAVEPGWIGLDRSGQYGEDLDRITHDDIRLCISMDDEILIDRAVDTLDDQEWVINLEDSMDPRPHVLNIRSYGFTDRHMPLIAPDISTRAAVRLAALDFESMDVTRIFREQSVWTFGNETQSQGGDLWASNAEAWLSFTTPIYQWLLENRQGISKDFYVANP